MLTVPIFVYALGVEAKPAIAMSLGVVGVTALVAVLSYLHSRDVSFRVAAIFGPAAMVGAYLGAWLALYVSGRAQLIGFGVVLLISAALMIRNARRGPLESATATVPRVDARAALLLAMQGLGVGVLTAIIGVGGGFVIVPALVLIAGLPMRIAVGTSLVIISMNALSGFAGYLGHVAVDWPLVGTFTALAAAGTIAGSFWSRRVPQAKLKQMFAYLLILVALYVLYRTLFADPVSGSV